MVAAAITGGIVAAVVVLMGGNASPSGRSSTGNLVLVDQKFNCRLYRQPLDFDLLKVTITADAPSPVDAVGFHGRPGECTGRIGRLEIDTWKADGIKIGESAHDLVIESGYVNLHAKHQYPSGQFIHQDGIQAMGGSRVTFTGVRWNCETASNACWFMSRGANAPDAPTENEWATDIICDFCVFTKGAQNDRVIRIYASIRSGLRNSKVYGCGDACPGQAIDIGDLAVDPVVENTVVINNAECNDTFDNDFDGQIDMLDLQCTSETDNQEAN
jgi:hypothetical protein